MIWKKKFIESFIMNTCHQFSKFMMNIWRIWAPEGRAAEWQAIKLQINKMASMAIIMIEGASINATAFVGGSYPARQVETKIVLKKRKGGMISQWRSTKWPTKSIKKIEQSSTVGLQLMPESRSRQNRILLIRIMLWSWTTRCIIKILIWGNHYCLTSTSQVLHKNKVKWSTSEKWLWLMGLAASHFLWTQKKLERKLSRICHGPKAFWKGLPAVKKLAQEAGVL